MACTDPYPAPYSQEGPARHLEPLCPSHAMLLLASSGMSDTTCLQHSAATLRVPPGWDKAKAVWKQPQKAELNPGSTVSSAGHTLTPHH